MSSFCKCKSYSHFCFSKNISIHAIINDQSFNDILTNDIVSFELLGPHIYCFSYFCTKACRNKKVVNTFLFQKVSFLELDRVCLCLTFKFIADGESQLTMDG